MFTVPPSVDVSRNGDAAVFYFGILITVPPPEVQDHVPSLSADRCGTVEISHKETVRTVLRTKLPFAERLLQPFHLPPEVFLRIIPPSHVDAQKGRPVSGAGRQRLPGLPVGEVPDAGNIETVRACNRAAAEDGQTLIVFSVPELRSGPGPPVLLLQALKFLRQDQRTVILPDAGVRSGRHPMHGEGAGDHRPVLLFTAFLDRRGIDLFFLHKCRQRLHLLMIKFRFKVTSMAVNIDSKQSHSSFLCVLSKICPVSRLPVHISLIFSGVLNCYRISLISDFSTSALGP